MEAVSFGGTNTYSNDEILKTQFAKNAALAQLVFRV
jgi:zinc protease